MPISPALTQFSTDTPGILVSNPPTTEVISCARYLEGMGFSVSGCQKLTDYPTVSIVIALETIQLTVRTRPSLQRSDH